MRTEVLKALLIARDERMWDDILSERKKISIREGHREVSEGRPLVLFTPEWNYVVLVDVLRVRRVQVRDLTPLEIERDGYASRAALIDGLRRFYPGLNLDTSITVVEWHNVRGKLVDEYRVNHGLLRSDSWRSAFRSGLRD